MTVTDIRSLSRKEAHALSLQRWSRVRALVESGVTDSVELGRLVGLPQGTAWRYSRMREAPRPAGGRRRQTPVRREDLTDQQLEEIRLRRREIFAAFDRGDSDEWARATQTLRQFLRDSGLERPPT